MTAYQATLPAPTLENRQEQPLPGNRISVKENSAGVVIKVNTINCPVGTEVTAHFRVIASADWTETKPAAGPSTEFIVENSLFKLHEGKNATISYDIAMKQSEVVLAPIVP
jgi:hypothetical protein